MTVMHFNLTARCTQITETLGGYTVELKRTQWQIPTEVSEDEYTFEDADPSDEGAEAFDLDGVLTLYFNRGEEPGFEVGVHYCFADPEIVRVPWDDTE